MRPADTTTDSGADRQPTPANGQQQVVSRFDEISKQFSTRTILDRVGPRR